MATSPRASPAWTRFLLGRILPREDRAAMLSFLDDVYELRCCTDGRRRARLWYRAQLAVVPARLAIDRLAGLVAIPRPGVVVFRVIDSLRLAVRRLVRTPVVTAACILTLTLGIAAATATQGLVKNVLLDPLPYVDGDRLVSMWHRAPGLGIPEFEQSEATYLFYRDNARTLDAVGLVGTSSRTLSGPDVPERVETALLSETMIPLLGVAPQAGRPFAEADTRAGAPPVAILAHRTWRRLFAADPDVLGRSIELDGRRTEIIGVMPEGFEFPTPAAQLWLPLRIDRSEPAVSNFSYDAVGRMAPGVEVADVSDELGRLLTRMPEVYSDGLINAATIESMQMDAFARALKDDVVGSVGGVLWVLVGTVAFVLSIALANVANLFLVRAEVREQEVAVRAALGARRAHLIWLFLSEGVVVVTLGAGLALALAWATLRGLVGARSVAIPRASEVGLDASAVGVGIATAIAALAVLAIYPVVRYQGGRLLGGLRDARGSTGTTGQHRARNVLVVVQVALALVLLVGASLMARSFYRLARVNPGFDASNVLTMRLFLNGDRYATGAGFTEFYDALLAEAAALPGVETVGGVSDLPMRSNGNRQGVWFEDFPVPEDTLPDVFLVRFASPGYFESLRIPLWRGRTFEPRDHRESSGVLILSRSIAERLWPGVDPVGKRARRGPDGSWHTVVGVVDDIRNAGLNQEPEEVVYYPIDGPIDTEYSYYPARLSLAVRTNVDPTSVVAPIRALLQRLDPTLPVASVETMGEIVADSVARTAFTMRVLATAAAIALLLGAIGIYGVISYVVGNRTREIGVRMALGAQRRQVSRMVVRQGVSLALLGVGLGTLGAAATTRFLSTLLYDVSPLDPLTFGVTAIVLVLVAALACFVPARRASAIDPAGTLRAG